MLRSVRIHHGRLDAVLPASLAGHAVSLDDGRSRVLAGLLLIGGYVALDRASLVRPLFGLGLSPWEPAPALLLAFLFFGGRAMLPYALTAPFLSYAIAPPALLPWHVAALETLLLVLPFAAMAELASHKAGFDQRLCRMSDVLLLTMGTALATALTSLGTVALFIAFDLLHAPQFVQAVGRRFSGLFTGVLGLAPLLFAVSSRRWRPACGREEAAQAAALGAALIVVFGYQHATAFQLFYLLFLPMLWITLRNGITGSVVMLPLVQIGLVVGAEFRFGGEPGLVILQVLMAALSITALFVGAVVTERETVATRLRDQQAALFRAMRVRSAGETAVAIAHELNQPLAALSTYSELTRRAVLDGNSELALRASEKLTDLCGRAHGILKSTRKLVATETGEWKPTSLPGLVGDVVALVEPELKGTKISITTIVTEGIPPCSVDKVQIEQALYNLIVNAIEAIREDGPDGRVVVALYKSATGVSLEVRDSGSGFPPGLAETATNTFITTKPNGSGLGLAIARSVAESHGGSLTIGGGPGGAVVTLTLPTSSMEADNGGYRRADR